MSVSNASALLDASAYAYSTGELALAYGLSVRSYRHAMRHANGADRAMIGRAYAPQLGLLGLAAELLGPSID